MYCTKCGKEVEDGAKFCPYCGASLEGEDEFGKASTRSNDNETKSDDSNAKSKLVAGILQIIPGLGIGRFYAGYTGIGIAQLLLTLFFGVGSIWCLVDGILILTGTPNCDAEGVKFKD